MEIKIRKFVGFVFDTSRGTGGDLLCFLLFADSNY